MKRLLAFAAGIEGLTGLALLVAPVIVTRLLLGGEMTPAAIGLMRLGGAGLLGLGIAGWPLLAVESRRSFQGILTYNVLATLLLADLGIRGIWSGVLLWPAVVLHAIITLLLVVTRIKDTTSPGVSAI